ncbi:acyltransferase [Demequina activiva]
MAGAQVGAGAHLRAGIRISDARQVRIGVGAFINEGVYVDSQASVTIGERVRIADHVRLLTSTHRPGDREQRAGPLTAAPLTIGHGAWIGSGATVLPGADIATGCVVAAGAVVTEPTADDGLYAGVPARRIRDLPTESP